tara:strand:- start:98 stop:673 length:576 start_codon:yes stop_codon:yes gene_type:complete
MPVPGKNTRICACPNVHCRGLVGSAGNFRKNCAYRLEHGLDCQSAENKKRPRRPWGPTCSCPNVHCRGHVARKGDFRKNCAYRLEHGLDCFGKKRAIRLAEAVVDNRRNRLKVKVLTSFLRLQNAVSRADPDPGPKPACAPTCTAVADFTAAVEAARARGAHTRIGRPHHPAFCPVYGWQKAYAAYVKSRK